MNSEPTPCRCNCGYTCGRQCGLDIMECIKRHYQHDCEHKWDGEAEEGQLAGGGQYASVTCSRCGMAAISHAYLHGA